ncbi:glycosyl hydrolase family 28 protein [Fulvivirgaceae bacterium BMA10]|uniref:Glycosyl hydrolase family 28 protein n=1 Tax=Splendidivirga corallicola TaxID=3051826 RepID=A0ABT8KXW6_9BACT|nr:glycosyl hydrolase family 28 protein [Fulvivirgaceae bacterium BMA10]
MNYYNIQEFGAKGDGKTDDHAAIQAAIDACHEAGGGRVLIPAGKTFLSGPFKLKSNIEFYVQSGATLLANPDETIYTESAFRENKGEGTIWIGGENLEMVTISGGGIIDGNGTAFMGEELEDAYELKPFHIFDPRPHILTIVGGDNIRIRNVSFKNAAYWALHLIGCNDVAISDITILNSLKVRNSDGIDLDHSRNVRINNCYIESGDDCICFKNRREYAEFGPCEDITVTGCTLVSTSCAIKIGSENMDRISHITFINCIIKNSNRGIGIQHRDEGIVSDIVFSNMIIECRLFSDTWWGKAEPIYVTAYPRSSEDHKDAGWRLPEHENKGRVGYVKNITFSNIRCKSENGVFVGGECPEKVFAIRFNDVDLEINKSTAYEGGVYDCRPCTGGGMIKGRTSGFYFSNASKIFVSNCYVNWGTEKPDYFGNALEADNVKGLTIENFEGEAAFPEKEDAIKIYDSEWVIQKMSEK